MSEKQNLKCKPVSTSIECTCSICEHIISEPHQVSCCGAVFCQTCIASRKGAERPCWSCKSNDYDSFPDLRFAKEVVKCPKGYKGCSWKGELGKIKEHLNPEPPAKQQLEGCQFYKVCCLHCHELFRRNKVKDHQIKDCLKRAFTCEYCNTYQSAYEDVKKNHEARCGQFKISCPKGCGKKIPRQEAETHPCPKDIIDCEYKYAGCQVRILRRKMESHLKEYQHRHISLHNHYTAGLMQRNAHAVNIQDNSFPACLVELTTDTQVFPVQLTTDTQVRPFELTTDTQVCPTQLITDTQSYPVQLTTDTQVCPVELTLAGFSQYEQENKDWYSTPFCTIFQGYTMCLKVSFCQRQIGDGRYITLDLHLMKGEFDEQLHWPLKADFQVQLLKWDAEEGHHTTTISFNDHTPQESSQQVRESEMATKGVECKNFISLGQLKRVYLKEDKCRFRISTT